MDALPKPILTERFTQAVTFACAVHRAQSRKGTSIPYVSHLLGVASLVLEHGGDEDAAVAALLHDTAEDQGGLEMLAKVEFRFGPVVARIVRGCTDTFDRCKPDWVVRKRAYLRHLASADTATCLVSCADKVHNARAILHDLTNVDPEVFARFRQGPDRVGWYYGALARALPPRLADTPAEPLAKALQQTTAQIAAAPGGAAFARGLAIGTSGGDCP